MNLDNFSVNKVRQPVLDAGYWCKQMRAKIKNVTEECEICKKAKTHPTICKKGKLPDIEDVQPREFVAIDIVGPLPTSRGCRFIVTITDHASRYVVAVPTSEISAKRVAEIFWNNWIFFERTSVSEVSSSFHTWGQPYPPDGFLRCLRWMVGYGYFSP